LFVKRSDYVICGDFNFGITTDEVEEEDKKRVQNVATTTNSNAIFIEIIKKKYGVEWPGWKQPIQDSTMVNLRRYAIHDGFLIPPNWYHITESGVDKPDFDQTRCINSQDGQLAIVKTSFIKKLILACVTDHWPIYITCELK